jgi:hypothetical protein
MLAVEQGARQAHRAGTVECSALEIFDAMAASHDGKKRGLPGCGCIK